MQHTPNRLVRSSTLAATMLGCIVSATLLPVAHAQPLIDNTDQPISAVTILGTVGDDRLWAAQSFSSPRCAVLTSIDVFLGQRVGNPTIVAQLRTGPEPSGPVVATFTLPPIPAGPVELLNLPTDAPVVLAPRELYWIVLASADPDPIESVSFGWAYALGDVVAGDGAFGNYWYSVDANTTWQNFGNVNPYLVRMNINPRCPADFNCSGSASVQDIFDFLAAWFSGDLTADVNRVNGVTVQDIFDFLAAWFAGC